MESRQIQPPHEIILFTRYPEPGKVKTRLIPLLGRNGAAQLHRNLTEHVIGKLKQVIQSHLYHLTVYYTGGSENLFHDWLGKNTDLTLQAGDNLGHRMERAFRTARNQGFSKILLIGSDCPFIHSQLITEAVEHLDNKDLVIGPTHDGGYYLIGIDSSLPENQIAMLFKNVSWGTSDVYQQTLKQVQIAGLSMHPLQQYHDIDRPEDLEYFNYNPDIE